jgi:hypothetical protein
MGTDTGVNTGVEIYNPTCFDVPMGDYKLGLKDASSSWAATPLIPFDSKIIIKAGDVITVTSASSSTIKTSRNAVIVADSFFSSMVQNKVTIVALFKNSIVVDSIGKSDTGTFKDEASTYGRISDNDIVRRLVLWYSFICLLIYTN